MWKCIVKWTEKGRHWVSAQGAPFSTNFIFCNPYSYYSRFFFFFITFDVSFWHPFLCSVLVPHFQPLWRPLIRSDFFTFLRIFWGPFLISVCYHSFQFLLWFLPPHDSFLIPNLTLILNILAPFLVLFPCSLAPSNLFLLSLTGHYPCVFLFMSYFLLISSLFSFSFAYFLSLPFSPSLAPLFFPFFSLPFLASFFFAHLFGAPLRPPGVQAHAMHPPGYATVYHPCPCW